MAGVNVEVMNEKPIDHETHVEPDPDAAAYVWVCACGEGDELFTPEDAYLEARLHVRLVG